MTTTENLYKILQAKTNNKKIIKRKVCKGRQEDFKEI